jgi:porin
MPSERGHTFEPTDPSSPRVQSEDIRRHEKYESFGKYAFGLWGYSEKTDDLADFDAHGRSIQRHSQGGYVLAEKTLLRTPGSATRHLDGFARFSFTDGDSTAIEYAVNLGLRLREPISGREDDILGIALSHARLSDKYRDVLAARDIATGAAENALEITYQARINDGLAIQPVYQYIRRPGGESGLDDVQVMGLRVELNTP